jgi:hypothetical protein
VPGYYTTQHHKSKLGFALLFVQNFFAENIEKEKKME